MTRRRNILHLFQEHELYNQGEIIRLVTKRPKVEKKYEVKYQEVWSKLGITLPWLVTEKKSWQEDFIECVVRDSGLLTYWEEQWCSGLLCEPDAHPGKVLNRCHRNSVVSHYFLFHGQKNCYLQSLLFTITFFWNTHAISYTWCSEQPYIGVLLLPKSNLISRAEGSQ